MEAATEVRMKYHLMIDAPGEECSPDPHVEASRIDPQGILPPNLRITLYVRSVTLLFVNKRDDPDDRPKVLFS